VKPSGSNNIRSDRPPQKQCDRHRTGDDSCFQGDHSPSVTDFPWLKLRQPRFKGDRYCSKPEACSFKGDRCSFKSDRSGFRLENLSSELQCSKVFLDYSNSELQSCPLKSELLRFECDRCYFNPQTPRTKGRSRSSNPVSSLGEGRSHR